MQVHLGPIDTKPAVDALLSSIQYMFWRMTTESFYQPDAQSVLCLKQGPKSE